MSSRKSGKNVPISEIKVILKRLEDGEIQHLIAAEYRTNQGRLSELKNGKRETFPDKRI